MTKIGKKELLSLKMNTNLPLLTVQRVKWREIVEGLALLIMFPIFSREVVIFRNLEMFVKCFVFLSIDER